MDHKANDVYLAELDKQFERFRTWAIAHYPSADSALAIGDFAAVERELRLALHARLHSRNVSNDNASKNIAQYEPVAPMPWP